MNLGLINKGGERLNYTSIAPTANRFYNDAKCSISNKITDAYDMFDAGTGLMFIHQAQHFYVLLERAILYKDNGDILGGAVPTNINEISLVDSSGSAVSHNILSVDSGLVEQEKELQFIDNKKHAISWRLLEVELTASASNDLYFINDVLDSSLVKVTLPKWDNLQVDGEGVSIRLISQADRAASIDRPILIPNTEISGNMSEAPYYAINGTITNFLLFVNNGKTSLSEIDFYKYVPVNKDRQFILHYIDTNSTMDLSSGGFINISEIGSSVALSGSRYYHKVFIEIYGVENQSILSEALYKISLTASIENAVIQAPKTPKNYKTYDSNDINNFGQTLYNKLGDTESLNNVFLTFMKMWSESDCYNNKISTITSSGFTDSFYETNGFNDSVSIPPLFDVFKVINGTSEEMGIDNDSVVKSNGISWTYI